MTTSIPRARCNATGELMTADMTIVPGVTLLCELSLGHRRECEWCRWEDGFGARKPVEHDHPEQHAHTLRWPDPTTDELAEVLDPDESFDLEVDIADEALLEQQQNNAIANGEPVDERDYPREVDPIPEAPRRCSVCGKAIEYLSPRDSRAWGWQHADRSRGVDLSHPARP